MKHAIITNVLDSSKNVVKVKTDEDKEVCLLEAKYTREELDQFEAEKAKWIMRLSGSHYFLADSDSGEDARGDYCGYFDLLPERAVFDQGKLVGYYLCPDSINYSGISRSSYSINDWGYPGHDPFKYGSSRENTHIFLFSDTETHTWDEWSLLEREPGREYKSYLDF